MGGAAVVRPVGVVLVEVAVELAREAGGARLQAAGKGGARAFLADGAVQ